MVYSQHAPHIGFYQRTLDGNVLNGYITFPEKKATALAVPLLDNLFNVKGCKLSSYEVMLKFYQADAKASRRVIAAMTRTHAAGELQSKEEENRRINCYVMAVLNKELSKPRLYNMRPGG